MNLADIRKEYTKQDLSRKQVKEDPIEQFQVWMDEAMKSGVLEPTAMNVATVDANGRPSSRILLLKGVEEGKFVFYTNYESRKGQQIAQNPFAALNFFWPELERQVRVEGKAEKLASPFSDAYFQSRPRLSRIGAHASPQSQEIPNRFFIEKRVAELGIKFALGEVPRPAHWGGYGLVPDRIEFWQGRPSRLHDRILFVKQDDSSWHIARLAP